MSTEVKRVTLAEVTSAAKALDAAIVAAKALAKVTAKSLETAKAETAKAETSAAKAEALASESAIIAKAEALAKALDAATSAAKALDTDTSAANLDAATSAAKALDAAIVAAKVTSGAGRPKKTFADWTPEAAKVTSAGRDALAKALATDTETAKVAKAWKHPTEKMAVDVSVSFSVDGTEYAGKFYMSPETDSEKLKETATKAQLAAKNALAYGRCVGALAMAIFGALADGKIGALDTMDINNAIVAAMAGNVPENAIVVSVASGEYMAAYDSVAGRWTLEK